MIKQLRNALTGVGLLLATSTGALACMDYDYSNETLYFNDNPAQIVVQYVANIADRDLTNSRGVRLTNFAAVLQQDRANLHKSGFSDDPEGIVKVDNYFTTAERRSLLSSSDYFFYCDFTQKDVNELKNQIVEGRVQGWLSVTVFKRSKSALGVFIQLVG